jgi:hypothetical protein
MWHIHCLGVLVLVLLTQTKVSRHNVCVPAEQKVIEADGTSKWYIYIALSQWLGLELIVSAVDKRPHSILERAQ